MSVPGHHITQPCLFKSVKCPVYITCEYILKLETFLFVSLKNRVNFYICHSKAWVETKNMLVF